MKNLKSKTEALFTVKAMQYMKRAFTLPNIPRKCTLIFLNISQKIKALCDENDVELVLIKIPISNVSHYNGWNRVKSEMAHEFAEENDVTFIDLTYDVELINHETDYRDWGYHLNILGAEKVSAYLGEWMVENIDGLNTDGNADYDASLETYRVVRDIAYFQAETDFTSFLDMLYENMDHWTIYIYPRTMNIPIQCCLRSMSC